MHTQVRCQECYRLVSCQELRLGEGGRKLCCDCYTDSTLIRSEESRPDWRKAEEAKELVTLTELTSADPASESAGATAEVY